MAIKKKNEKIETTLNQQEQITTTPKYKIWELLLPPTVLTILTTLFYYPSLKYPFQFDDIAHITKNFYIRNYESWTFAAIFKPRWFADWLNKINYKMGEFNPLPFRAFNLAIHILAGITLFFLVYLLLSKLKKNDFLKNNALIISSLTTAFFLLHPVQTQLVSYVIQARLEGLATLFIFLTILLITIISQSKNFIFKMMLTILLVIVSFISCSSKEIVIVSPFLAIACDWFLISEQSWENFKSRIWIHLLFSTIVFGSFIYFQHLNWFTSIFGLKMTAQNNRGNVLTQTIMDTITPYQYCISEFKVILHYLIIFIFPFGISVEYDWKLASGFFSSDAFLPFLVLVIIASIIIRYIIKKQYSYLTFGLTWFLIAIAPRSSIIPSAELICDYKTYLPSAGLFLIFAVLLTKIINYACDKISNTEFSSFISKQQNKAVLSFTLLIPLGLGLITRNKVWQSNEAFWEDITIKAPLKARGWNNLGVAKGEANKWDEAIKCYKQAINLDSFYADPWSNIAVAYSTKNEVDLAIEALKTAIRIFPNYPEAYNNLGSFFLIKKDYQMAENCFNTAITLRSYYGKAHMNLGRLFLEKGEHDKAYQCFLRSVQGDLDNAVGFQILGEACVKMQKYKEGADAFQKSIEKGSTNPQTYFNLANCFFMTNETNKAESIYEKLIASNPNNPQFIYNLGETKLRKEKYAEALNCFAKAKELPQGIANSHIRIAFCLEKLGRIEEAKNLLAKLSTIQGAPDWFKLTAQNELKRLSNSDPNKLNNQKLA